MSKKKRASKAGPVWHQSSDEATLAKKPLYNGFACGHGAHGNAKYCRAKEKRTWEKQLKREGASHEAPSRFPTARALSIRTAAYPPWFVRFRIRVRPFSQDHLIRCAPSRHAAIF